MPMATRAGTKRAASAEPDREEDQHILVRSELSKNNKTVIWNLTPGRHTPAELVHAARNTFDHGTDQSVTVVRVTPFQPPVMTKTSRLPILVENFQSLFQTPAFEEPNRTISSKEVDICVQNAFNIFDRYFFFNKIGQYTTVTLVHGLLARRKRYGEAMDDLAHGRPYQLIRLDLREADAPNLTSEARAANMKKVLGTLLHEMVHCVFRIFKCTCALCERDRPYVIGGYGHGFCWIELSNAVQRVARQQFDSDLNLQCDEYGPSVRGFREDLNKRRRIGS